MKELKNKYTAMKMQAKELMQRGNISAYLAKLHEIQDIKMQIVQLAPLR